MVDRWGRPLTTLRFNITKRCNFSCFFCHREGEPPPWYSRRDPLTPRDYGVIAEAGLKLGVRRFKLTGGEPLVRADVVSVVRGVREYGSPEDLSMTTNGYYLPTLAPQLADAGLDRVNVSIHSLRAPVFREVTGVNGLDRVLEGVRAALDSGLGVKLNFVVLKGVNDGEVPDLIDLASNLGVNVQLIELQPVGLGEHVFSKYYTPLEVFMEYLDRLSSDFTIRAEQHNRPTYTLNTGVRVELVMAYNNPYFCSACNRMRVTSNGYIQPCIMNYENRVPLIDALRREGHQREDVVSEISKRITKANQLRKPYY